MGRENSVMERETGTTAWKIRIDNHDLDLLNRVAENMAEQDAGLIPKPSITALIQTAVKYYIAEALQRYPNGSTQDSLRNGAFNAESGNAPKQSRSAGNYSLADISKSLPKISSPIHSIR